MQKLIDLTGQRFGKLTVIEYDRGRGWLCRCDCGRMTYCLSHNLRSGSTKTCGRSGCKLGGNRLKSDYRKLNPVNPSEDDLRLMRSVPGVCFKTRDRMFTAKIRIGHGQDAKYVHLGSFSDVHEAIKARKLAEFDLLSSELAKILNEYPEYEYDFETVTSNINMNVVKRIKQATDKRVITAAREILDADDEGVDNT